MLVFLIFQVAFDVILLASVWLFYRQLSAAQMRADERRIESVQRAIADRIEGWEKEIQQMKTSFTEQLDSLRKICDKASETLSRAEYKNVAFLQSEEEVQLKKVLLDKSKEIPTLKDVENTKERLRTEIGLDLRTVLRDQLA